MRVARCNRNDVTESKPPVRRGLRWHGPPGGRYVPPHSVGEAATFVASPQRQLAPGQLHIRAQVRNIHRGRRLQYSLIIYSMHVMPLNRVGCRDNDLIKITLFQSETLARFARLWDVKCN